MAIALVTPVYSTPSRSTHLDTIPIRSMCVVQILTHLKEKVQFISKESAAASAQQASLDGELADKRDTLGRIKGQRDDIRSQLRKLKE